MGEEATGWDLAEVSVREYPEGDGDSGRTYIH